MKTNTALRLLANVMDWSDEDATREFRWMDLMARLKYDDYREFLAGMRFLESLVAWLQQFDQSERAKAYSFVRERLVFVSPAERQRLVELLYPRVVWPVLVQSAMQASGAKSWEVLVNPTAREHMKQDRRSTLFLALSDGARLDAFRHANAGRISNEQVVVTVEPSVDKCADLLKELRRELSDPEATFRRIVLVDDFTASGTSLLRQESGVWKGKLPKFLAAIGRVTLVAPKFELLVHHLIGTPKAYEHLVKQITAFRHDDPKAWEKVSNLVDPSFGLLYPADLPLDPTKDAAFITLTNSHYDAGIETSHTLKGGAQHLGLGYAQCALPLVLDHNTPNNSVALLWAETEDDKFKGPKRMRPLFRRRQRHS
ncbi:hypothetical protein XarbCFBP8132_11865 [Xanthomonas arboricola]|uniref:phosphoribosyltransferase-like protein n=1 Tax=Xanthomonas arboricola TaxID=56448 RepID=UPI000CEDF4EC|nr:hypothetical protein [Xanthomonas arboricola]PPT41766.1 hypothetical protein XarbCFBP8132_11865 [Xanthomonas arboricola]